LPTAAAFTLSLQSHPWLQSGHVILDEFALHNDQRSFTASPSPSLLGGTLTIITTVGLHLLYELIVSITKAATPWASAITNSSFKAGRQGIVDESTKKVRPQRIRWPLSTSARRVHR